MARTVDGRHFRVIYCTKDLEARMDRTWKIMKVVGAMQGLSFAETLIKIVEALPEAKLVTK
jgi:hypothetical protein